MEFYYTIWVLIVLLTILEQLRKKSFGNTFYAVFFIVTALIVGCRYFVGTDWDSYRTFYYTGIAYDKPNGEMDIGFSILRNICYSLGMTHAVFLFIVSMISFWTLYKAAKLFGTTQFMYVFLVYFSLFFINYQFNIVRHGLAASLVWLGYAYKANDKLKPAIVYVLAGVSIHYFSIIYAPFVFFISREFTRKTVVVVLALSFACVILQLSQRVVGMFPALAGIDRLVGYLERADSEDAYGLSMGSLFNVSLFTVCFFLFHKQYIEDSRIRVLLNSLLLSFVFLCVMNAFAVICTRVCNLLNVAMIFILPLIGHRLLKSNLRLGFNAVILVYLLLYYQLSFLGKADSEGADVIPYVFDSEQLITPKQN